MSVCLQVSPVCPVFFLEKNLIFILFFHVFPSSLYPCINSRWEKEVAMVRPEMVGTVMAVAVLFLCTGLEAQHSKPIPDNSHIERNKFKQRDVTGNFQSANPLARAPPQPKARIMC